MSSTPSFPIDYLPLLFFLVASVAQALTAFALLNSNSSSRVAEMLLPRNILLLALGGWRPSLACMLQLTVVLVSGSAAFFTRVGRTRIKQFEAAVSSATASRATLPVWTLLVASVPLLLLFLHSLSPTSSLLPPPSAFLSKEFLSTPSYNPLLSLGTVDMVFSYYDEDLDAFKGHVERMKHRPFVLWRIRTTRVIVYNKGPKSADDIRARVGLRQGDEVISLPNKGREGGTYLSVSTQTLVSQD